MPEDGSLNQRQVEGGIQILEFLVPLFLDVMMGHPEMAQKEYWGRLRYPVRLDIREDRGTVSVGCKPFDKLSDQPVELVETGEGSSCV